MMGTRRQIAAGFLILAFGLLSASSAETMRSQLVAREIQSKSFAANKIGVSPVRKLVVYLPAGYDEETKRFPVVYFFPCPFEDIVRSSITAVRKAYLTARLPQT